jgi:AAA domain
MNFHTEDFRPANEANDVAEPFSYMLPRDITLAPKAFLIDRFVAVAETSAWYGPPDGGKSTVALDAGCHVAAGLDYCGRPVMQGGVLYIAIERGAVVKRRVLAWCKHHDQMDIPLAVVAERSTSVPPKSMQTGSLPQPKLLPKPSACPSSGSSSIHLTVPLRAVMRTAAGTWGRSLPR